jgi:8-oxo-dGTP diphosphatase
VETDLILQKGRKREQSAVLCFVIQDGQVLLIRKKKGLGAGKVNAPGGRIEPGEAPVDAARRETQEEVGLTPHGLARAGELFFRFTDGLDLYCTVFTAQGAQGELTETEEALPFWKDVDAIPYADMWADDAHWVPWMLAGRPFRGTFRFDDDRMLEGRVEPLDGAEAP